MEKMNNPGMKKVIISFIVLLTIIFIVFMSFWVTHFYTEIQAKKLPHVRCVLEMDIPRFLESLAKNKDKTYQSIMDKLKTDLKKNPQQDVFNDIQELFSEENISLSKYYFNFKNESDKIIVQLRDTSKKAFNRDISIILDRMKGYNKYESSIKRLGKWRIALLIPLRLNNKDIDNEQRFLIKTTGFLELCLVKDPEYAISVMKDIDDVLSGRSLISGNQIGNNGGEHENKAMTFEEFSKEHPFFSVALLDPKSGNADAYVSANNMDKLKLWLSMPQVKKIIPNNCQFVFSAKPVGYQNGQGIYKLYCVNKTPEITGGVIANATATISQESSAPIINIQMNSEGASEWARITGANIHKRIVIILDGVVYSAPVVQNKITGGNSQITGMVDMEEAQLLAVVLKSGAFSAPMSIISIRIMKGKK